MVNSNHKIDNESEKIKACWVMSHDYAAWWLLVGQLVTSGILVATGQPAED